MQNRKAPAGSKPRSIESVWADVIDAQQNLANAQEVLRRALSRMDARLDQQVFDQSRTA